MKVKAVLIVLIAISKRSEIHQYKVKNKLKVCLIINIKNDKLCNCV